MTANRHCLKFYPVIEGFSQSLTFIIVTFGGIFIMQGKMTIADLTAFTLLKWGISEPMKNLGVYLNDFISELPNGYETVMVESGALLSQGQKQLLALARTMASDPKILILDEATSLVDTKIEKSLQLGMEKMLKGRTSFIVAHRLSTIRTCDKIMCIDHGEIVECGTHEQLMKLEGNYYQLVMME